MSAGLARRTVVVGAFLGPVVSAVGLVGPVPVAVADQVPGQFVQEWGVAVGEPHPGQLDSPEGVAVDGSGNVYVADGRVMKFNAAGDFVTEWGTSATDVAVDDSGFVYVTDAWGAGMHKYTPDGVLVTDFAADTPGGVAVDDFGSVYVTDVLGHRVQKFTADGVFVTSFGSPGSGPDQLSYPMDVAVDHSGNIYVANYGNSRVVKLTSSGAFVTSWEISGQGLHFFGVAVDNTNHVYVADTSGNRVQKFTADGALVSESGPSELSSPRGVAVDDAGDVYIGDYGNSRVAVFTGAWEFVSDIRTGLDPNQFVFPTGAAVDTSGDVYISDFGTDRVQKFTGDGVFVTEWGQSGAGPGDFTHPYGIAVDPNDNVYVVDSGNNRVQKFTSDGTFLAQWGHEGSGPGEFEYPTGIAVDASGNVYVTQIDNPRVQKFSADGTLLGQWGDASAGSAQLGMPTGVAVSPESGDVYIADATRVRRFTPTGAPVTQWTVCGSCQQEEHYANAVAFDPGTGDVFVTEGPEHMGESGVHRVARYSANGARLTGWGALGEAPGEFDEPLGIAVTDRGDIYVADEGNQRVQRFRVPFTVAKTADETAVQAGGVIHYHVAIRNTGTEPMTGVTVTDPNAPDCAGPVPDIAINHTTVVDCTYPTTTADIGTHSATATVNSDHAGPGDSNQVDVTVLGETLTPPQTTPHNTLRVKNRLLGDVPDGATFQIRVRCFAADGDRNEHVLEFDDNEATELPIPADHQRCVVRQINNHGARTTYTASSATAAVLNRPRSARLLFSTADAQRAKVVVTNQWPGHCAQPGPRHC